MSFVKLEILLCGFFLCEISFVVNNAASVKKCGERKIYIIIGALIVDK